jgi:hypothetical protein
MGINPVNKYLFFKNITKILVLKEKKPILFSMQVNRLIFPAIYSLPSLKRRRFLLIIGNRIRS